MCVEMIQSVLVLAKRLAREAAAMTTPRLRVGQAPATRKADNSPVTEVDRAIETHLLQAIAEAYPDHAVCAEESADQPDRDHIESRYCWVIDPLDGTRNFVAGLPCFSTSIALLDRGQPLVGVVMEHNLQAMFAAAAGQGATLNDQPLHVWEGDGGPETDLLIGIPSSKDHPTVTILQNWTATRGMICRNLGSTALHLGLVAAGMLGAAFCRRCKLWDIAAGALLVTEAGGQITDPTGRPCTPFDLDRNPTEDIPFLAAAPHTHQRLRKSIHTICHG